MNDDQRIIDEIINGKSAGSMEIAKKLGLNDKYVDDFLYKLDLQGFISVLSGGERYAWSYEIIDKEALKEMISV